MISIVNTSKSIGSPKRYSNVKITTIENVKPKLDHNIILAGLLVTDADTSLGKVERATKGPIKGLYYLEKEIPTGKVYILNGAEFPNADAVDLLLYLLWHAEQNNWSRILELESLNKLAKDVLNVRKLGSFQKEKIRRYLIVWSNHYFYFPNSFVWKGEILETYFGIIDDWEIKSQGRGKPSKLIISFNEKFLRICKETDWYRRPKWLEVRKLRKEIAKRLYMLALEYKPSEKSKRWKIYIDKNLKHWYRNALNSLASPEHLYPKLILEKRIKPSLEEISQKTDLKMELQQTDEGNYCIVVKQKEPEIIVKENPFEKLSNEEKFILINHLEAIKDRKNINNVFAFAKSLTEKELKLWLNRARKYLELKVSEDRPTEYVEKPRLMEILEAELSKLTTGRKIIPKVLKGMENNKRVVFICSDRMTAKFLNQFWSEKLKEIFKKPVFFEVD